MSEVYTHTDLTLYLGLSSTEPNADGTNITEPVGGAYARIALGGLSEPVNGTVSNLTDLTFPLSAATWFTSENPVAYYVIFDGNGANAHYLSSGEFASPREIAEGVQIKIIARSLSITLTDPPESVV